MITSKSLDFFGGGRFASSASGLLSLSRKRSWYSSSVLKWM
ncbi:fermentation associated protein [Colletotrichum scovillei]|uniref:Fermentation associated protein n=1 Tax=Colletotrichum scovillei TaxID=1209932 RepID=A0A9P7QXC5_9PEZI|nr:fermentation associated protein [Colletotrichum scovillei]KAG7045830.1 fermentation associated protein [Colletotrichum scovillei]KAG7063174.1 fermentation associated protein [Colletotrichum scovillei]